MSYNQSRSDKSDTTATQYGKSGRSSNLQRSSSSSYSRGGGGPSGPAPSPSLSSSRSFKKVNYNNAPAAGQSRANPSAPTPIVHSSDSHGAPPRNVQNGPNLAQPQPPSHGLHNAPVASAVPHQTEAAPIQRNAPPVPMAPTSQHSPMKLDSAALPTPPNKVPGDASKAFHFQFGSLSPGFMNGMQIPARTSSAPPNLDEQKRDQARNGSFRVAPSLPTPAPKQQATRKDANTTEKVSGGDVRPIPKAKMETQGPPPPLPPVSQGQQPPVLPFSVNSMQLPFHQPQKSVQYVGPNPQIQPQGVAATSLQMPVPVALPLGNAPQIQQPVFVQGLPPHPLQAQGIMQAQGQGLSFPTQMASHLPPQMGNMGMGISSQHPRPQGAKFGGQHKTVKITHPKTHEELRLADGGTSGTRSHLNVPQSQPISSYPPPHAFNFYPNSYGSSNMFFPAQGSMTFPSGQMTPSSLSPRFNYTIGTAAQTLSYMDPSTVNSFPVSKSGTVMQPNAGRESAASKSLPVTTQQFIPDNVESMVFHSSSSSSAALPEESPSPVANADGRRRETPPWSNSNNDHQKKTANSGYIPSQHQVNGQSSIASSLPSDSSDCNKVLVGRAAETVETKTDVALSVNSEGLTEASMIGSLTTGLSELMFDETQDGSSSGRSEASVAKSNANTSKSRDESFALENLKNLRSGVEQGERDLHADQKPEEKCLDIFSASGTIGAVQPVELTEGELCSTPAKSGNEVLEHSSLGHVEPVICQVEDDKISDAKGVFRNFDSDGEVDESLALGQSSRRSQDVEYATFALSHHETIAGLDSSSAALKQENEAAESTSGSSTSLPGGKDKPVELTRTKSTTPKVKKRMKEILQKADALGITSDLYMAYKGPEDKKENIASLEVVESTPSNSIQRQAPDDVLQVDTAAGGQDPSNKAELDDWEDAVDMSTPKLETSDLTDQDGRGLVPRDEDGNVNSDKKYSRDFLLKFSELCTDLPDGFEITSEISEALICANDSLLIARDPHSSAGRVIDKTNSASRIDRRISGVGDEDRWSKLARPFGPGRDLLVDIGFAGSSGFRPMQAGNFGVQRIPRAQAPMQYVGGILSGPMQSMVPQGGVPRSSSDADRWQRVASFPHRGLIPSPTPLQVMHKAEKKYEVGKVTDEEESKQRQLKAILNKLTPQNFDKLFEQVKAVNIDNAVTLTGVISQIFDKALMEPTFCEMYANFCFHLAGELPDFSEDNEKITFKRLLLNKCQEEFEKGEREQEEANKAYEEGEIKQSEEEREQKRVKARRRMLGNIRLIGELYKKRMLTEKIMHECIKKLLGQCENPDEEDLEALCKLMSTIGEMFDNLKTKVPMDSYFKRMAMLTNNMNLSSRIRFMLKDVIDLRKNKWQQRRKVEGPKKIDDVHRDAAQERQLQASRLVRNSSMNPPGRRAPFDFSPRGPSMPQSPNTLMGGFRGSMRGYGTQDVRLDERHPYEARTLAVPLPQRPPGDDSITLGPQGGLARGMSVRGAPAIASTPVADPRESRRVTATFNGFANMPDRSAYNTREDLHSGYVPERFGVPTSYDQFGAPERSMNYNNRDLRNVERGFERPVATSPPSQVQPPAFMPNISSGMAVSDEHLRDKSMASIKEFYSARDEKEVGLCIKELNYPSFHSVMISLWVTDSFERKQMERDLLAKLIVNLGRSQDNVLTHSQLVKGFEFVLATLDDAVNDAPKAVEYLGHMFARLVLEKVVSLREIGQLLREGGGEPGYLLEVGLAGDVLGNLLEMIKLEEGDTVLNQIKATSNLQLGDFLPPTPNRSKMLEKFI